MSQLAIETEFRIRPRRQNFAAVVEGVNAKEPLTGSVVQAIKDALLKYKVVFFKTQNLTREEHIAFAAQFGVTYFNESKYPNPYDEEGVANVSVVPHFHADVMYHSEGPAFSILRMIEVPEVGGNTMWLDLVSSYRDLSPMLRSFLETLTVEQGVRDYDLSDEELNQHFKQRRGKDLNADELREMREELAPWEAPMVRLIPETNESNYWIAPSVTRAVKGMTKGESEMLLPFLFQHLMQPKYLFAWNWDAGDIAFWDQRTTLHCGMNDYGAANRHGNRISIVPNKPIRVTQ